MGWTPAEGQILFQVRIRSSTGGLWKWAFRKSQKLTARAPSSEVSHGESPSQTASCSSGDEAITTACQRPGRAPAGEGHLLPSVASMIHQLEGGTAPGGHP